MLFAQQMIDCEGTGKSVHDGAGVDVHCRRKDQHLGASVGESSFCPQKGAESISETLIHAQNAASVCNRCPVM